jgi:hypothetical protein
MSFMAGSGQLGPESNREIEAKRDAEEAKRALRRRILKAGVIGAPLVITLKSNASWAASAACINNLQVPQNIPQNVSKSSGGLVPYTGTQDQRRYMYSLQHDQTLNGMPGYSCVASLMLTQR